MPGMMTKTSPQCTAFLRYQRVASGAYPDVLRVLEPLDLSDVPLLVFDDVTGAQVDYPWPADFSPAQPDVAEDEPTAPAATGVGRPRLGVVAREVTLLPRHWQWLAQQRGGASAALRRLVDEARKADAQGCAQRLAKESGYRFMSAIGGDLPGFEEATRALFANDAAGFSRQIAPWPTDVQAHLAWMTRTVFNSLES